MEEKSANVQAHPPEQWTERKLGGVQAECASVRYRASRLSELPVAGEVLTRRPGFPSVERLEPRSRRFQFWLCSEPTRHASVRQPRRTDIQIIAATSPRSREQAIRALRTIRSCANDLLIQHIGLSQGQTDRIFWSAFGVACQWRSFSNAGQKLDQSSFGTGADVVPKNLGDRPYDRLDRGHRCAFGEREIAVWNMKSCKLRREWESNPRLTIVAR